MRSLKGRVKVGTAIGIGNNDGDDVLSFYRSESLNNLDKAVACRIVGREMNEVTLFS